MHPMRPSYGPAPCPAPSQHATAIPDASCVSFMCPSPSHDLMHMPWPPLMHPDMFQHTPPLLDTPLPSQMHPMCLSYAPATATTSSMCCGPLRCVPMCFNAPHPFSMCHRHLRHVLCAFHVPQPQPQPHTCAVASLDASQHVLMHPAPSQHATTTPNMSHASPTCHGPCPRASQPPQHVQCALYALADDEWGGLCVASELAGIQPSVHYACLSVHSSD